MQFARAVRKGDQTSLLIAQKYIEACLTKKEAAALLGVSVSTIQSWIAEVPSINRVYRRSRDDLRRARRLELADRHLQLVEKELELVEREKSAIPKEAHLLDVIGLRERIGVFQDAKKVSAKHRRRAKELQRLAGGE